MCISKFRKKSDAIISLPQRGRGTAEPGSRKRVCTFLGFGRGAVDEEDIIVLFKPRMVNEPAPFLYKISLAEVAKVLIGELETVAEEAFGAAPDIIDLVKRRA